MISHRLHGCHKCNYYVSWVASSMASPDHLPNSIMRHMTHVTTHIFKKLACRELVSYQKGTKLKRTPSINVIWCLLLIKFHVNSFSHLHLVKYKSCSRRICLHKTQVPERYTCISALGSNS